VCWLLIGISVPCCLAPYCRVSSELSDDVVSQAAYPDP
jgi:hypothetical protein